MRYTVAHHPDPHNDKPFPPQNLVENRPRIDVWLLQRAGALALGAETTITVNDVPVGYVRGLGDGRVVVEFAGQKRGVELVQDEPMPNVPRLWFECPACQRRCRHLYLPEVECRTRLALEHAVRHSSRWGRVARIARPRHRLGVDLRPFGELHPSVAE